MLFNVEILHSVAVNQINRRNEEIDLDLEYLSLCYQTMF